MQCAGSPRATPIYTPIVVPVGCAHDEDPFAALHAVHLCEKLVDDAGAGVVGLVARPTRTECVEFVEEDDARRRVARPLKHLPDGALALANILKTRRKFKNAVPLCSFSSK